MKYKIPSCTYFGSCGGCAMRHMTYPKQLEYKQKLITDILTDKNHPKIKKIAPSPVINYYRNKMEFAFGVWDGKQTLGLRAKNKFYKVIDIHECFLQSKMSNAVVDAVRSVMLQMGLEAYHRKKNTGCLRYAVIREGKNTDQYLINIITSPVERKMLDPLFNNLREQFPHITTAVWSVNDTLSDVAFGKRLERIWGPGYIKEKIGSRVYKISPYSFFQTNTQGAEVLYTVIKKCMRDAPRKLLLDMYAGTGGISIYCAKLFDEVIGIEINPHAVSDAHTNVNINKTENIKFTCMPAEYIKEEMITQPFKKTTVVVDPPRPGLESRMIEFLCTKKPACIIYVSCNPYALAKDLQRLSQYYTITFIQPIDLFPHTPHIETVVSLKKK